MKKYFPPIVLFILVFVITTTAQVPTRCNHHNSFEKTTISDTLDAIQYAIHLSVTDFTNHEIEGNTIVEIASKVDNTSEIKLELMDLSVDEISVDGVVITNYTYADDLITIPLSTPLNTGETADVEVHYHGVPFHESWGGFHWSGEYAFNLGVGFVSVPHNLGKTWFPCIDDFEDRALYDLFVTVEDGKDAVCGGLLVEIVNNGNGTNTYHWTMSHSIPTYLASVAVGDYAKWTDIYNGINEDIPIEIWVKPADSNKVDDSFVNLKEILSIYEDKFGPYRWSRIGYVGTAIGAMEHATNIAYPHFAINGNLSYESLFSHELSHMWFGDNITCSSAEEMWLNEGWAVFCDAIMQEFLYSRQQYLDFILDKHKTVIQLCHTQSGDGSYFPLNQIPQNVTYGMSAYDRGSTVVHTLRGYLGDSVFFDAMAAYNENFKYNYASSYDMRDFLTSYTGIDMTDWFDNWVLNSGTPHYSVDSFSVVTAGTSYDVTVYMRQKRHGPAFIGNSNIVELTFMDNNWNMFTDKIQFDGETGNSVFEVPFAPDMVLCDLNQIMCDATTEYSFTAKETGEVNCPRSFFKLDVQNISDSAFVMVEHNWAPPDSLKNPVQGLTISDYRYWKIDGIFPDDFVATGIFWYSKNGFLDDGIITNPDDSLVMLYRPATADDWQFIDFTQIGVWSIGNLYVDNLQKGEYVMAVCDDTFVGILENTENSDISLNVYPNPSDSNFSVVTDRPGILKFYDINGKSLDTIEVTDGNKQVTWLTGDLPEGTYFVRFISENYKTLAVEKLILIKN